MNKYINNYFAKQLIHNYYYGLVIIIKRFNVYFH